MFLKYYIFFANNPLRYRNNIKEHYRSNWWISNGVMWPITKTILPSSSSNIFIGKYRSWKSWTRTIKGMQKDKNTISAGVERLFSYTYSTKTQLTSTSSSSSSSSFIIIIFIHHHHHLHSSSSSSFIIFFLFFIIFIFIHHLHLHSSSSTDL